MELKPRADRSRRPPTASLNRTFYGIETRAQIKRIQTAVSLNRTFYGIETPFALYDSEQERSLNRTFYGIETRRTKFFHVSFSVLIVPFMELKPRRHRVVIFVSSS